MARRRFSLNLLQPGLLFAALFMFAIFGAGYAFAQNPPEPPTRPPVINAKAQEILNKVIQALGGASFLAFKHLTTSGRAFTISDEQTAGLAPFESAVEFPDKRHVSYGKKQPVVLINNGDKGWEVDRYGKISQKRVEILRWKLTNRYSLENLLRVRLHEPGFLAQDGGEDFVDQAPVRIVTMVDAQQSEIKLYVHHSTYLPVRITYHVLNPATKEWDDHADVYGDYQRIQGIQTPMHITRFLNDERVSETYRNSAKYDENFPASYFEPPQ